MGNLMNQILWGREQRDPSVSEKAVIDSVRSNPLAWQRALNQDLFMDPLRKYILAAGTDDPSVFTEYDFLITQIQSLTAESFSYRILAWITGDPLDPLYHVGSEAWRSAFRTAVLSVADREESWRRERPQEGLGVCQMLLRALIPGKE
jgi:hypothetical protein